MPWREIGTILLILTAIVILGNLWFHLVESILERIKRLFIRNKQPPVWHTLPPEQDESPK